MHTLHVNIIPLTGLVAGRHRGGTRANVMHDRPSDPVHTSCTTSPLGQVPRPSALAAAVCLRCCLLIRAAQCTMSCCPAAERPQAQLRCALPQLDCAGRVYQSCNSMIMNSTRHLARASDCLEVTADRYMLIRNGRDQRAGPLLGDLWRVRMRMTSHNRVEDSGSVAGAETELHGVHRSSAVQMPNRYVFNHACPGTGWIGCSWWRCYSGWQLPLQPAWHHHCSCPQLLQRTARAAVRCVPPGSRPRRQQCPNICDCSAVSSGRGVSGSKERVKQFYGYKPRNIEHVFYVNPANQLDHCRYPAGLDLQLSWHEPYLLWPPAQWHKSPEHA